LFNLTKHEGDKCLQKEEKGWTSANDAVRGCATVFAIGATQDRVTSSSPLSLGTFALGKESKLRLLPVYLRGKPKSVGPPTLSVLEGSKPSPRPIR